jgi:nicotinamide mononucleotide adenylyltransferase
MKHGGCEIIYNCLTKEEKVHIAECSSRIYRTKKPQITTYKGIHGVIKRTQQQKLQFPTKITVGEMSTKVEIRANKYVDGENSVLFQ